MIRPTDWELDLLWGRPFSIYSADNQSVTLFVQKVGRGTGRITAMQPGDEVAIWGPLGNSFVVEPDTPTLLLAGGIGIAPFRGYVESHPNPNNLSLFLAHRLPLECYPFERLCQNCSGECMVEDTPEDLTAIIETMGEKIKAFADRDGLVLACGPTPFMRTVQRFSNEFGARAQVSLENRMACGVGACLGCVSRDSDGQYTQVCTKGPVFWADKVEL